MVAFRNIFTAALALATPITAAITPAEVVVNIQSITSVSLKLQVPAQKISIVNGPLILIGQGPFPELIVGFADIVSKATLAIAGMQGMPTFVRVHQVLLNILIGKAGLFQSVPFIGTPIAAVLRQVEKVVDTIAFGLIATFEARANDFKTQAGMLTGSLQVCIASYDGISVARPTRRSMAARREIAV
ncbi:hypothetical protein PTNB73_10370 [Pyrenophora teres f. teres]|nr:hypothetical protein PTNB85_10232 [Pyrenophora teres f. teres]KAE8823171.1 hypothetical protein HRS9139_09580 [Pyrenophora teres f. teres]KAE8834231.1 hypothetical protein HRS9122_08311 [Pyrenophora teres f. teres]KAE8854344.1 hypothetical protein PTNB29_09700 [Pyrenophora teres f. teres]KAE8854721.1 hypothetical protein PTNB73_10370 [Pyrenophora teres f. teres]